MVTWAYSNQNLYDHLLQYLIRTFHYHFHFCEVFNEFDFDVYTQEDISYVPFINPAIYFIFSKE